MKYNLDALPPEWRDFAKRHQKADSRILNHKAFGRDGQLDLMLDTISRGNPLSDNQLSELYRNQKRKHWLRGNHLRQIHTELKGAVSEPADTRPIIKDQVAYTRRITPNHEWRALELLSSDYSYARVAMALGLTLAALRSRVSRCRKRIRRLSAVA